ncbi:hypothetical protein EV663_103153 [Rhodovulum bhavnagarense]|uniref:Muramidase (Phage lysozyme) n=1 Tax=Rhodovulum bhavnagarense TaxID=992286 RepID=A0A4V6NRL4_9RHOB|nr:hypothetical protein [Rhodovulum bhavnagarense]TCP61966.1 hypothetical protein EV663_103153 [Rhodovulum bhavnagarense]
MSIGLRSLVLVVVLAVPPRDATAGAMSLLGDGGFLGSGAGGALIAARPESSSITGPSLFAGIGGTGILAPMARRGAATAPPDGMPWLGAAGTRDAVAAGIRDLVARAEAGTKGYDAVQHGARLRPPRAPTRMTLAEIDAWIRATPGQPHAIGRYQFIPSTLRRLVAELGVAQSAVFSPALQDALADRLLDEAGLSDLLAGRLARRAFMNNLARVWAGLPNSGGKSHYHGFAGNRATMSWAQFETQMGRIFPG